MVGKHDATCTDANGTGMSGDIANNYRCSGTGDADHVVVFRHPIPPVAQPFYMARQLPGI
jgi:hypothetical protein